MANNTDNHKAWETNDSSREPVTTKESNGEVSDANDSNPDNHKVWETNDSARCPFTGGAMKFTTSTRRSNAGLVARYVGFENSSSTFFAF